MHQVICPFIYLICATSLLVPYVPVVTAVLVILNSPVPLSYVKPAPALRCALTSAALGPVYVNVLPEYARLPSPPASTTFKTPEIVTDVVNAVPFHEILAFAVV